MRLLPSPASALAAAALLAPAAAKGGGRGGGRPSGGGGSSWGSRPNASPTGSRPSYSSPSASRVPAAPTRPDYRSPGGPMSPTQKSSWNPSPAYKPVSDEGAPLTRSGGGGYGTLAKQVFVAAAVGTATMIAVQVAAGYFLYGGRHSSPYCRGDDAARFGDNCPRGQSSQNHGCTTNIPLCPIPEQVRSQWNLGADAPPKVEVKFDKSVCSTVALTDAAATDAVATDAAASNATAANATTAGVTGQSGLDACLRRIVAAGGCDAQITGHFLYAQDSGDCGCCTGTQVTTLPDADFAAAVYSYRAADDLTTPPTHCISGSTMYYPAAGGGPDETHACECGTCSACGGGRSRYLDWSGPFVVPDAVGESTIAGAEPAYDPVDTCLCNDISTGTCEADFEVYSGAGTRTPGGVGALAATVLVLWHIGGRG